MALGGDNEVKAVAKDDRLTIVNLANLHFEDD
jgi:hypothetical protein